MTGRHLTPPPPFDPEQLLEEARFRRAVVAGKHVALAANIGVLVDQLGECHADLERDDALHQALHAVVFVWQYFEQELLIVAAPSRNCSLASATCGKASIESRF
jgi:hypothetical protein